MIGAWVTLYVVVAAGLLVCAASATAAIWDKLIGRRGRVVLVMLALCLLWPAAIVALCFPRRP